MVYKLLSLGGGCTLGRGRLTSHDEEHRDGNGERFFKKTEVTTRVKFNLRGVFCCELDSGIAFS